MGFFKKCFGPSKAEIWSQLAQEMGVSYEERGLTKQGHIVVKHGEWSLVLDTYVVSTGQATMAFTRMRAPFVNKDGLYFKVYRESSFSAIGRFFGMQDIEIGDQFFDDAFVIKGNDEYKIRQLFKDDKLKSLIDKQPRVNLEIRDDEGWFGADFPEGVDELVFTAGGVVRDIEQLKSLFELFSTLLERLVQIDSAYEDDPQVSLYKP